MKARIWCQQDWIAMFDYRDGALYWKPRPRGHFASDKSFRRWNGMYPGRIAGWKIHRKRVIPSCIAVSVNAELITAHRIIWEMHYGAIPDRMVIDHIDRNAFNNLLSNLRCVTSSQNAMNAGMYRTTKSGYKGIQPEGRPGKKVKWRVLIGRDYRSINLGLFEDLDDAIEARKRGEAMYHGQYAATT